MFTWQAAHRHLTMPPKNTIFSISAVSYTHLDVYKRQHMKVREKREAIKKFIWTCPISQNHNMHYPQKSNLHFLTKFNSPNHPPHHIMTSFHVLSNIMCKIPLFHIFLLLSMFDLCLLDPVISVTKIYYYDTELNYFR